MGRRPDEPIAALSATLYRVKPVGWSAIAAVGCVALLGCGPSTSADDAIEVRLQDAVDEFLEERLVPGASVAVIHDGELVEVVGGVADVDTDRSVTDETPFRVASVTKMYMAAVVLNLVDRGELSLDRPISAYGVHLPERLAFVDELTLRQLLSHTTGLTQTFTRDEDRHRSLTAADIVERIPPPVCPPSACWSYADGNYVVAQLVLEAATGAGIATVFGRELLGPLDLRQTAMIDADVLDTELPPQYALTSDPSGRVSEPPRLFEQSLPRTATLVTTAADAARFADALFSGDMLDADTLDEMLDTASMRDLPCAERCPFEYGLGVFHYDIGGRHLVGHDGSSGAIVVHEQNDDLTVAILTNGGDQNMGAFLDAVLAALDHADR